MRLVRFLRNVRFFWIGSNDVADTSTDLIRAIMAGGLFTFCGTLVTVWFTNRRGKADVDIAMRRLEMETEAERQEQARKEREEERDRREEERQWRKEQIDRLTEQKDELEAEVLKLEAELAAERKRRAR